MEKNKIINIKTASENLFNYAVERDDLKYIIATLPKDNVLNLVKVEYEIVLLKIISVGWAISYFLEEYPEKEQLSHQFWLNIHEFCKNLSFISTASMNKDFDYFVLLKERFDTYFDAIKGAGKTDDPTSLVGPEFAVLCGAKDNALAILAGSKMFSCALSAVRNYLDSIESAAP